MKEINNIIQNKDEKTVKNSIIEKKRSILRRIREADTFLQPKYRKSAIEKRSEKFYIRKDRENLKKKYNFVHTLSVLLSNENKEVDS